MTGSPFIELYAIMAAITTCLMLLMFFASKPHPTKEPADPTKVLASIAAGILWPITLGALCCAMLVGARSYMKRRLR